MTTKDQYLIGGVIFGVAALIFIGFFGIAAYAAVTTYKPAYVPMAMLFGIFGFGSLGAMLYGFRKAV